MSTSDRNPDPVLAATLAAIEADRGPEAGALFVDLVSRALRPDPPAALTDAPDAVPSSDAPATRRFTTPPAEGRSLAEVVRDLERDLFDGSLWPGHAASMSAPLPAPLPASVWSEALIAAMNQSLRMESMSPTGTPLETDLIRWMARLIGWGDGAGGTFTSGASESNFSALLAARARVRPAAWTEGVGSDPPIVLAAPNVHFCIARALGEIGLGTRCLDIVPSDDLRLDAGALDRRLREHARAGRPVMAVVATSGAHVTGVFDDLEAIGAVCDAHGAWLHVDAAIGGAALLSSTQRWRLAGIERASSVAWDLHKLSMIPLQAGVLIVKDERALERAFAADDDEAGRGAYARSPDQCDRSFQNSRRFDALKLWVALQRHGAAGLGALYDQMCSLAGELHRQVTARPDFEPLNTPESSLVIFRYVGDGGFDEPTLDLLNRRIWSAASDRRLAILSAARVTGHVGIVAAMTNPFFREDRITTLLDHLADLGRSVQPATDRSEARP